MIIAGLIRIPERQRLLDKTSLSLHLTRYVKRIHMKVLVPLSNWQTWNRVDLSLTAAGTRGDAVGCG